MKLHGLSNWKYRPKGVPVVVELNWNLGTKSVPRFNEVPVKFHPLWNPITLYKRNTYIAKTGKFQASEGVSQCAAMG